MTNFVDVFGGQVTPPSEYGYQATTIASNTTAYWPYNYAGTGLVLAKNNDITASAASLAITLPDATEVSTGEDFIIKNAGANTFEVKDNAGNTLTTILAGVAKYFVLTSNSTAAGIYDITTFGTGTSSADAGILAGAGHRVDGDAIDNIIENELITASKTISATDNAKTLVYKSGTVTLTLPDPSTLYSGYFFIFINDGSGTVTLNPTASITIDSNLTKDLQPGESCIVTTDGANYYTAGYGRSNTYVWTQLTVDLTGLSSYTVTSTQATNKLWYFFNVPTGSMTVTIPAVASVYFLRVGAIGSYSLTFSTGSGATVVLTANQSYIIYCDGTNITAAQTVAVTSTISLNDGSAASPTLYFTVDSDTGLYRQGTNQLGIAAGGVSAGYFSTAGFIGNVTGNVTGSISGTATNATNVGITDDTSTSSIVYPTWVTSNTGNLPEKVSSTKLTYQPSTGTLTSTVFAGTLSGNASTATSATTAGSATTATTATNIAGGSSGSLPYQSGAGATSLLGAGTSGYVLTTQGPGLPPTWGVGVPSGSAANLSGGSAGAVVYQSAPGATAYVTVGTPNQVLTLNGSSVPTWTTLDALPSQATHAGQYLTTNGSVASWADVGASAGGVIYENTTTISANYTLSTNKNGMSVGPITIDPGYAVTVPSGQRWVIL